jgi:predicted metal-binding protein
MKTQDTRLDEILKSIGYDFKWISGDDVVVSRWVRMKCMFGCDGYGKKSTCPPNVPSLDECAKFFTEYDKAAIIHLPIRVASDDERRAWARKTNAELVDLERSIFLAGFPKAFILPSSSCYICTECPATRLECIDKESARPTPEALGVDVFETARRAGFPIEVLTSRGQTMNRYALLMVE